ncbi:hypothetical protein [Cohnella sp. 56]|uniref:hypothetical protein n=1 Tax=Cohnella sp. 56 TaxID=3113722 RepID=UPI0030EA2F76
MNKRRSLLVGLGVGLMAGAALLQLMTYGEKLSEGNSLPQELTVEQLQKQANAKDYGLYKLSEPVYTQTQLDEAVAKAKQEAAGAGATGGKPAQGEADAAGTAPAPSASPPPAGSGASEPTQRTRLGLYVAPGDTLDKVATGLKGLGVISDKAAFIRAAKPSAGRVQVGLSVFDGQTAYDEIIAELVRDKG